MNNSPYLDRPLIPLAIALPRMLEKIEADLATAGPAETRRLRQRAELIRDLLAPAGRSPIPSSRAGPPAWIALLREFGGLGRGRWHGRHRHVVPPLPDLSESRRSGRTGRSRNLLSAIRPVIFHPENWGICAVCSGADAPDLTQTLASLAPAVLLRRIRTEIHDHQYCSVNLLGYVARQAFCQAEINSSYAGVLKLITLGMAAIC
jgi:hypothetical protein